jgi:hypothetical protein
MSLIGQLARTRHTELSSTVGHPASRGKSAPVVATAGSDPDLAFGNLVDEPMFFGDPSQPVTSEVMLERFRLADVL